MVGAINDMTDIIVIDNGFSKDYIGFLSLNSTKLSSGKIKPSFAKAHIRLRTGFLPFLSEDPRKW